MESRLQSGTFIYKKGLLVTKGVSHLQNGILALQTGISDFNSSLEFKNSLYGKFPIKCCNLGNFLVCLLQISSLKGVKYE